METTTPNLSPKLMKLDLRYVNKLLGLNLGLKDIKKLLEKMRFGVKILNNNKFEILIPAYRTDILHPIDLVEDVAIAYNYNNFNPEIPELSTIGEKDKSEKFYSAVRELMLGFNFQEVMTLIMTNEDELFDRMNISRENVVKTKNPVSLRHSVARSWLLPSLMSVFENNKNREYPQRIFETGLCIDQNGNESMKLAAAIAHSKTNYAEIKSIVTGFLDNIGVKYKIKELEHGSFIDGRCAGTGFGFFGEINPIVIENFGLEVPITAFEFNLDRIFIKIKYGSKG